MGVGAEGGLVHEEVVDREERVHPLLGSVPGHEEPGLGLLLTDHGAGDRPQRFGGVGGLHAGVEVHGIALLGLVT